MQNNQLKEIYMFDVKYKPIIICSTPVYTIKSSDFV